MTKTIISLMVFLFIGAFITCGPREPGGTKNDVHRAIYDPDEYAWELFFFLNRPARTGLSGIADATKKFGDIVSKGSLVWETWALASGGDKSEVFMPDGSVPSRWEDLPRHADRHLVLDVDRERLMINDWQAHASPQTPGGRANYSKNDPDELSIPDSEEKNKEVRINRATFESVVAMKMYSCGGLYSLLQQARSRCDRGFIHVPTSGKEVKARWIHIDASQKSRYYWREGDDKQLWGLAAFHISTKDLPNWFWADFGHIDCEDGGTAPCYPGPFDDDPVGDGTTATALQDSTTTGPNATHGINGLRDETKGTVWQFYRLRGTQTDFIKPWGEPWLLSNPVLEKGKEKSSCIACHARAAIGSNRGTGRVVCGTPIVTMFKYSDAYRYVPHFEDFGSAGDIQYLQTDFMWTPIAQKVLPRPASPTR